MFETPQTPQTVTPTLDELDAQEFRQPLIEWVRRVAESPRENWERTIAEDHTIALQHDMPAAVHDALVGITSKSQREKILLLGSLVAHYAGRIRERQGATGQESPGPRDHLLSS